MEIIPTPRKLIDSFKNTKKNDNRNLLFYLLVGIISTISGIVFIFIADNLFPDEFHNQKKVLYVVSIFQIVCGIFLIFRGSSYNRNFAIEINEKLIFEQERKVAQHPKEPKLAWDLARIKLESYLNRNISQVSSIFNLSVFVMVVGFGLIIYGSVMVFQEPKNLNGSIVVAIAGLIVNFIGATFLFVYKSVMEQAKEYVTVLERINAVGMSVQIIDTINESHLQLKEETKAELSKKLIDLYTVKK
ncbi:TRADD-N-associated membrane domain-containing protein [Flavobacterium aquicola]|uniref:Cyanobacterial TRADD-N associated 2 transmembrane domain-containing protein n=1 Tax=Flavobacterium aquicola TaxID=1682742 RepID=A0A3E0ED85_9FLAO|nr:hypothetical protein [Flavobacterium aquicola]REG96174.1 hypothetical protein C8P67_111148 [Flavobacterium aquicola]